MIGCHFRPGGLAILALLIVLIAGHGCDQGDPVRVYTAPPDRLPDADQALTNVRQQRQPGQTGGRMPLPKVTWDLPEGWNQSPAEGMRFATIHIPPDPTIELAVMPFASYGGTPIQDVNFLRTSRLGLPELSDEEAAQLIERMPDARHNPIVIELGPTEPTDGSKPQKLLAVRMQSDATWTWFFRMQGDSDRIDALKQPFFDFVRSARFEAAATPDRADPHHQHHGHAHGQQAPPPAQGVVSFEKPEGWTEEQATPPGVATYRPADGSDAAIFITKIDGTWGNLRQNINRWRTQVGLPAQEDPEASETREFRVADNPALLLNFHGPIDDQGHGKQQLVLLFQNGQEHWFIRFMGENDAMAKHGEGFIELAQSIRIKPADETTY